MITRIYTAVVTGTPWPPDGVDDTPENRALRDKITAEVNQIRQDGQTPYVPWEYAD